MFNVSMSISRLTFWVSNPTASEHGTPVQNFQPLDLPLAKLAGPPLGQLLRVGFGTSPGLLVPVAG